MGVCRPGGLELTEYALKTAGVKPGDRILDIGCGDGTAAAFIKEKFGCEVIGIDNDEEAVKKAKEAGVDARKSESSELEFPSRSFDIVMMECVFSVLNRQEESLHEAYCMIKPGGCLIISDLYCREPDMERYKQDYKEAMAQFYRPREDGDCGHDEIFKSPYCQDGAVVIDGLLGLLDEFGLEVELDEDRTEDLKNFAADAIMQYGSLEKFFEANGGKCYACSAKKPGYFLLIARKKA